MLYFHNECTTTLCICGIHHDKLSSSSIVYCSDLSSSHVLLNVYRSFNLSLTSAAWPKNRQLRPEGFSELTLRRSWTSMTPPVAQTNQNSPMCQTVWGNWRCTWTVWLGFLARIQALAGIDKLIAMSLSLNICDGSQNPGTQVARTTFAEMNKESIFFFVFFAESVS